MYISLKLGSNDAEYELIQWIGYIAQDVNLDRSIEHFINVSNVIKIFLVSSFYLTNTINSFDSLSFKIDDHKPISHIHRSTIIL